MTDDRLIYRIAFSTLRSLTPALAAGILERTGSEREFFALTEGQLSAMMGFSNRLFGSAVRSEAMHQAEAELAFVEDNAIRCLYFRDEAYPKRLLQCEDAPLMLYGLGDCDLNGTRFVSVVGTRHATAYGSDFVDKFVGELASLLDEKVVIVSGLAYGIDICAHRAALRAGLPTVAVLAHGLNMIYPSQHRHTAAEIARSGGCLLTDYRSSTAIHKGNFLARNRIVAGLSDALVVVESASKGGALVTAGLASGYNRDVFALPGRITDKYSAGCNSLISNHVAGLVSSAEDFCRQMRWPVKGSAQETPSLFVELTPEEQAVVDVMAERGEVTLSELSSRIDMPVARLMALLVDMEFRSLIINIPGGRYRPR